MQLSAFVNAFRTPDLRKKLLFTLGVLALFRLGSVTPDPRRGLRGRADLHRQRRGQLASTG